MAVTQKNQQKRGGGEQFLFGVITAIGVILLLSMLASALIVNEKLGETAIPAIVVVELFAGVYTGCKVLMKPGLNGQIIKIPIFAIIMLAIIYATMILVFDCHSGDMKYTMIGSAAGCLFAFLESTRAGKRRGAKHGATSKRLYKMHIG